MKTETAHETTTETFITCTLVEFNMDTLETN